MGSIDNIKRIFDQATEHDREIAFESWWKYQALTFKIARRHGFQEHLGAAVFAALSPNNDYYGNLRDTNRLFESARQGLKITDFKVSTYSNNKRKAWRMAHGEEPLDLLLFPKTRNFYLNVKDPTDPQPVTVDGHIYNIWKGERIPLKGAAQKLKRALYPIIADDIRTIAGDIGLIANQVQAQVWTTWRRIHNIKFSPQLELWDTEYIFAGLGYNATKPQQTPENHKTPGLAYSLDLGLQNY